MQFISCHCLSQSLETAPKSKATTEISAGANYTFFRSDFKTPLPGVALAVQENVPIGKITFIFLQR